MNAYPAVLYVEDDARSRKVMQMLLQGRMGLAHVTLFEDSTGFAERIVTLDPKPNVIFLDIHVKPYNGYEMLATLRQLRQFDNVPVVALTASVMHEEIQQLRTVGFEGCLAKPVDPDGFPNILNRILNGESVWHIAYR